MILNINEVFKHLPHRYPFLLIDRVLDVKLNESLTAIKNVTINEPFFNGHFPEQPVMPGVLIVEALAQATGILAFQSSESLPTSDSLYFLAGIDNARFKQVVTPGDQLVLEVKFEWAKRDIWKFTGVARVDDRVACGAELMTAKKDVTS